MALCELCGREPAVSFHHFIPRTVHRNKWFKKNFAREEMQSGMDVCKQCHSTIHDLIDEKELGRSYNTREKLLAHPEVAKYVSWKKRRSK